MDRTSWMVVLLLGGMISVAVVVMTAAMVVAVRDLRRTLYEAHGVFTQARQLLTRANAATRQIADTVHQSSALITEIVDSVAAWKAKAERFFGHPLKHHGNGIHAGRVSTHHRD